MTYVTEQTSQELRAHMRRLKAMTGWHEPLADRLYKEILELDDAVSKLREAQAVQPAQQPFAWYDPSADKFTRDRDDPSMNRGAVLWRLYRDAQPSQAVELSEAELVRCISESGCYGTVKMSYESGPYSIDRPSLNATKFANAIIAAINAKVAKP